MRQDQLRLQRIERIEPAGIIADPHAAPLVVWGIHGAGEHVRALRIGDVVLERLPGEEVDALRVRAMREVVPNLPADAWRDSRGAAIGYFVYIGLDQDHCAPSAQHLEGIL